MKVFWEAFGNGSTFNAAQIMHFIDVLTAGARRVPGGKEIEGDQYKDRRPRPTTPRARSWSCSSRAAPAAPRASRARSSAIGNLAFCSHEMGQRQRDLEADRDELLRRPVHHHRRQRRRRPRHEPARHRRRRDAARGRHRDDFFENHARHEIGHAVGARKIGNMKETGNEFAESYGELEEVVARRTSRRRCGPTSPSPPPAGPPSRSPGANVTLTNKDVHDWCMDILAKGDGAEPTRSATAAGDLQDKLAAIQGSLWGGVKLVKYLVAIGARDAGGHARQRVHVPRVRPDRTRCRSSPRAGATTSCTYKKDAHEAFMGDLLVRPVVAAGDVRRDVHRPLRQEGAAGQGRHAGPGASSSARSRASATRCSGARSDDGAPVTAERLAPAARAQTGLPGRAACPTSRRAWEERLPDSGASRSRPATERATRSCAWPATASRSRPALAQAARELSELGRSTGSPGAAG